MKGINFKPSLASQKVIAVITAKDIPSGGENIGSSFPRLADEALFADQLAEFAGQNIGVVVSFLTILYNTQNSNIFMYAQKLKRSGKLTLSCCFSITQIAETQSYAYMAAKQAVVEYSTENLQPPILTIEDAIQHSSYFSTPPFLTPKPVGDYNQGMSEADHKILSAEVLSQNSPNNTDQVQ